MSTGRVAKVKVAGAELFALAVDGRERIQGPSRFVVDCAAFDAQGARTLDDPHAVVAEEAELELFYDISGTRTKKRLTVDEVDTVRDRLRLSLVSIPFTLEETCNHRFFVDQDAVAIATAVLGEHGIEADVRVARNLTPLAQSIQQFESELGYVSRILADEGIAWLESDEGKLVLVDRGSGYDRRSGVLPIREEAGLDDAESVFRVRLAHRRVPDQVVLRDYDFQKPRFELEATSGEGGRRIYEFPGGFSDPALGDALAAIRLGELQQGARVLHGESSAQGLRPGLVISLASDQADELSGDWLIVAIHHVLVQHTDGRTHRVRFEAVAADGGFRPPRIIAPHLGGVHTAVVTGPSGGEIHTEEHARIRLHHRWDRVHARDETSSQWSRVMQPQTSGSIFLPRVGWEVLTGFAGPSQDEPVVLGQLYNGVARPPASLPAKKVVSAFGTQSTPGGSTGHLLEIDDSAGAEAMRLVSSKDLAEKTENDKVTAVTADDEWEVGSRTFTIGQVFQRAVTGSQSHTVAGLRTVDVGANFGLSASSELVIVGGLRVIRTGGDLSNRSATWIRVVVGAEGQLCVEHYNRFVKGGSVAVTAGSWNTTGGMSQTAAVGGASVLRVGAAKSVKCAKYLSSTVGVISEKYASRAVDAGGPYNDKFTIGGKYDFSGDATFKGSNVTFEAVAKLVIKAGGVTITLTPGKIQVSGKLKSSVASTEGNASKFG